jgi:hypothetical protein
MNATVPVRPSLLDSATAAIVDLASRVPATRELPSENPERRATAIAVAARRRSAAVSAAAALPPGPVGWLTLLPEAVVVWRIQAQMVADIAGAYGRADRLTPELMLHCLFRHSAGRAIGGLVARAGERVLVRHASYRALQPIARAIAARMARRTFARGAARWVPGLGSAAIAAYAWRDTDKVAETAIETFARDIVDA